ncbi:hypothetical protein SR41_04615 [Sphingomonas melonis]|uniref:Uncharacterized protein n=1 Tax=Sphingomonas melonis TaxID=152682 RepID=A0A0D1MPG3_9SPHN|nr:hypothetical protein [Sphingomonas melonis]KIU29296.1 hypothetical protein SR41_04615 [Sphingomonas melonis]
MADTARIKANVGTMIDKGATEQEIDTYLQSEGVNAQALRGAPELPKAPPPGALDTISTLAGETLDGVIPNAGRTMRGVGGAIGNTIAAAIGRDSFRPVDAFHDEERQYDADKAQVDEGHPNLSSAAGWAGFAGSFGLPVARIGRGASLAARLGKGAANGAIYGAASGALNETGDGRLANAALGAAGGAAMGAAAYPAMNAAHSVFNTARRNIPGIDAGAHFLEDAYSRLRGRGPVNPAGAANAQAERMLADQMDGSRFLNQGMGTGNVPSTVDNVGAEVARRQGLGVPAMPADVSEDLRQTTAWALQGRGTMATRARQVLAGRQAQSGTRIRGHVTETMGPAVDPIAEVQRINQRASAASEPGYRAAYAQPMLVTPEIAQIMRTPAFRNAIPQAFENIRNGMGDPTRLGFRILAPGHGNRLPPDLPHFQASDGSTVVVDPNQLSFEAFDQISRQMRDSGQAAMNNAGFRPRDTTNSVHITPALATSAATSPTRTSPSGTSRRTMRTRWRSARRWKPARRSASSRLPRSAPSSATCPNMPARPGCRALAPPLPTPRPRRA